METSKSRSNSVVQVEEESPHRKSTRTKRIPQKYSDHGTEFYLDWWNKMISIIWFKKEFLL